MIKTVQTPSPVIGYEEAGPVSGQPVLLLHGWPYDPRNMSGACCMASGITYPRSSPLRSFKP
jgi:pimeloyl-ACP methyl ester carboxylesterase